MASLLSDWGALEPGSDRRNWMRSTIESGAWPLPGILGIFVPVGTSSTGDGPSRAALGDMELGFLDQVIGIGYVADQLDPPEDLGEDSVLREHDVSWASRVRIALRAVSRWAAANRQLEDGNEADRHPTGDE